MPYNQFRFEENQRNLSGQEQQQVSLLLLLQYFSLLALCLVVAVVETLQFQT
jgi:hypothetical protein